MLLTNTPHPNRRIMNKNGEDKMDGKFVKQNDTTLPVGSGFVKDGNHPDTLIKKGKEEILEDKKKVIPGDPPIV